MGTTEHNKQQVRMFYDEIVQKGQVDLLETFAWPDMVDQAAADFGWKPGREGFVQHIEYVHNGVSNIAITVDDLIAEDDRVVAYWSLAGDHVGEFFGIPATGKSFKATAVSLLTFKDDRLIEYYVRPDALGLLQQLGAIPS